MLESHLRSCVCGRSNEKKQALNIVSSQYGSFLRTEGGTELPLLKDKTQPLKEKRGKLATACNIKKYNQHMMKVDCDRFKRSTVGRKMATMISEAKKARFFSFPFIIDVCKPGRGRLVGKIL